MKKNLLRNIGWVALLAVWSFLAGAYFHLGWVRDHSVSYIMSFVIGGIGIWIVFTAMGILVYRFAKKQKSNDPAIPALFIVSFFTVCFLLIAWIKYDEVKKDKFIEDIEQDFVTHYANKAAAIGLKIKDLNWELEKMYFSIHFDLKQESQLEKLMELKSADALFEDNTIISTLCLQLIDLDTELGYPPPAGMELLFE